MQRYYNVMQAYQFAPHGFFPCIYAHLNDYTESTYVIDILGQSHQVDLKVTDFPLSLAENNIVRLHLHLQK